MPVSACPDAWRVRRVSGDANAVLASLDEETSASCSFRRSCCWFSAKRGIEIGDDGDIEGLFKRQCRFPEASSGLFSVLSFM
jgi:hypothetical protein